MAPKGRQLICKVLRSVGRAQLEDVLRAISRVTRRNQHASLDTVATSGAPRYITSREDAYCGEARRSCLARTLAGNDGLDRRMRWRHGKERP
jgi:hypothetical protein